MLSQSACSACGIVSGWRRFTCPECRQSNLCWTCADFPAIVPVDPSAAVDTSDASLWKGLKTVTTCSSCALGHSLLDMTRDVEVFEPATGTPSRTILFVHGGGGTRAMFRYYAETLAASGFRTVIFDLPGHGALHAAILTLETAIERIIAVTNAHAPPSPDGKKPIYVGASLGGYLGMEVIGTPEGRELFAGAIIMAASQTVGVGASLKARAGLTMMSSMTQWSRGLMVKGLLFAAAQSKHLNLPLIWRDSLSCGMFFGSAAGQIDILRRSNPLPSVRTFAALGRPVIFMFGDQDHHDNKARLEEASGGRPSIVLKGGDHFFSHDLRFMPSIVAEISRVASEAT